MEQQSTEPVERLPMTNALRAKYALAPAGNEEVLEQLRDASSKIVKITNEDGYKELVAARKYKKQVRLHITKLGEEAREDAAAYCKAIIARQKHLIGIIEPEEKRLQSLQDEWDKKVEAEKNAKKLEEDTRIARHQIRISNMLDAVNMCAGQSSEYISKVGQDLFNYVVPRDFEEFQEQADAAKAEGLQRLHNMWLSAVAHEQEVAKQQAERLELEELRRIHAVTAAPASFEEEQVLAAKQAFAELDAQVIELAKESGQSTMGADEFAVQPPLTPEYAPVEPVVVPSVPNQELADLQKLYQDALNAGTIMYTALVELSEMKLSAKAMKVVTKAMEDLKNGQTA